MTSTAGAGSTCGEDLSGLCELCDEAAEVECAACGPVRLNKTDGGPLLLCAECSTSLHSRRVFECHKLVNISRKLWLPVEERLELVKQHGTMLNDRKSKLAEEMKTINDNYNTAIEQLQMTMKELRKVVDDKEQVLINNLTDVKDQQLLNGEHVNAVCTSLIDHVTKITSTVNESLILEARQFAEQKTTLLHEMSTILEQPIPPLLSVSDLTFSLANSVTMVKRQMNDLLILPVVGKQVQAGECTQGAVVAKLNPQGLFWLKTISRESEGALLVISQSIRADLERDVVKPVTKATVGQFCCIYFSEDKQWHRARIVTMVSTTRVKICYIDYGNYEECSLTNLRSLPDKYLFYPFQTIRCCLTNDDGVEFSREARWLFNDRTRNKIVNLHIISELPGSSFDDNDVHYLVTVKEAGEGGADISSLVLSKLKEEQNQAKHPIIHRDYRLTQQHKLPASATPLPAEAPPNRPPSRLNTDAAEFVLNKQPPLQQQQQQPGVLQVSQSVFHKMVGVSVTKTPSKVGESVTGTVKENVTATPDGKGNCVTSDHTVTTVPTGNVESVNAANVTVDNVTATPARIGNIVTTTPAGIENNVTTTSAEIESNVTTTPADSGTTSNGNITNTLPVTENNVTTTTDSVITTPSGVGDVVISDVQDSVKITPSKVGDNGEVKDDMISSTEDGNVTTDMMGDKVNDKEEKEMTGSVDIQQSENLPNDNEALPCSDSNGCHGSHECTGSKDVTSNVNDVSSRDPEVGVVSSHEIDDVAPPPNEAVVAGATIEISVVSDLQSDGKFWSQLVADEETDESFCDLMESLQLICVELHSSQHYPQGTPLVGSFCTALFSADNIWYRALVEQVTGDKLLVRYMDYGNAEMVSHDNIVPLTPKMKELPFQAFLSTISSEERNNFTPLMCERFSSLVKTNDVFQAKVLSVKGGVVEVELTVQLNGEVINVNDDVYLTDFVTTHSLHFSQATDPKLTWTEQMEALDSPVTPTKDFTFQLATGNPEQPLPRERSKSIGKSKSHKSSPVCSVRKVSNCSSRRMLRRQSSSEKPSGNKKQQKKTTAVANEDTGIVPSSENWETEEESLVGGADDSKDDTQMLFIKGLPPTINMEAVRKLFSEHGNVKEVNFDHSYPGRAWITMDVKGAKNATSHLRKHVMSGGDHRGLLISETESFHSKSRYKGQGLFKRY